MKCLKNKNSSSNIEKSTFTVYNQDGSVLRKNATFEQIYSKEGLLSLILEATSLPLRVVEN